MSYARVSSAVLVASLVFASIPFAVVLAASAADAHILDLDGDALGQAVRDTAGNGNGPGGSTPVQPPETVPWGISQVGADVAWATSTGASVKVAVIDTGIQPNHPDLADNVKGGVRFYTRGLFLYTDSKWADDNGHGTHVAGTIAALDNTIGVVGVAPNVELYAVKVLDKSGSGSWAAVAAGIRWAADNGMDVASMSLGGSGGNDDLASAVAYAQNAGVVLVAAAGNSGDGSSSTTEVSYPAAYAGVIAVGATDSSNAVASWSSSAPYVALCAPGVSVFSTYKGSSYATLSGTSMATPHVSGVAALVLATTISAAYDTDGDGAWDPSEVKAKLQGTATDMGAPAESCGAGLVSASAAVA
jgi:subtilisin family serine protease